MVIVTGNLGIFSQSKLERISNDVSANAGNNNIKLNQVLERVRRLELKDKAGPVGRTEAFLLALGLKGRNKKLSSSSLLSGAGAPIKKNEVFKKLSDKVNRLEKTQTVITKTVSGAIPLLRGASGLQSIGGIGNLLLNQAAKIGLPIFFITTIATLVWKMYKAQYGKGGTRDIRKLVLSEDISRIGIENENELESGANLYLSYPQKLTGLPRGPSNTENLREGMVRWKQRHEGTYGR